MMGGQWACLGFFNYYCLYHVHARKVQPIQKVSLLPIHGILPMFTQKNLLVKSHRSVEFQNIQLKSRASEAKKPRR